MNALNWNLRSLEAKSTPKDVFYAPDGGLALQWKGCAWSTVMFR